MQETVVTNLPVWTLWVIAISQIIFALSTAAIAVAAIAVFGQVKQLLQDTGKTLDEVNKKMPSMMGSVDATLGNVKAISDDAKKTAHQVTGAVNKVADVTHSVATRLESPLVKSVGIISGLVAGARALRGGKRTVVVEQKRGFLGRKK